MANSGSEAVLIYDLLSSSRRSKTKKLEPLSLRKSASKKVIVRASNLIFDKLISVDFSRQINDNSTLNT